MDGLDAPLDPLQAGLGNYGVAQAAVSGLLARPLQAKLEITDPGDACEREAERVAETVLGGTEHPAVAGAGVSAAGPALRLQRTDNGSGAEGAAPPIVHEVLRSPGTALDGALGSSMGESFGADFSDVRVHTDAQAAASARSVGALAYTVGSHVVFGEGRYAPQTSAGQRLLAHELAHTIQQGEAPALAGRPAAITTHTGPRLARLSDQAHHIVEEVALPAAGFTKDEMRWIERGNRERDYSQMPHRLVNALLLYRYDAFGGNHPWFHFDNSIFDTATGQWRWRDAKEKGVTAFDYLTGEIRTFVRMGLTQEALIRLGNGFHTVEDFFAHTNFVRLLHGDYRFGRDLLSGNFDSKDQVVSAYNTALELSSHPADTAYQEQADRWRKKTRPQSHSRISSDHPTDPDYREARRLAALVIADLGGELLAIMGERDPRTASRLTGAERPRRTSEERERLFAERVLPKLRRYLAPPSPQDRWWEQMLTADPHVDERLDEAEHRTPVTVNQVPTSPMRVLEASREAQFRFFPFTAAAFRLGESRNFLAGGLGVNVPLDTPRGTAASVPAGLFLGVNLTGTFGASHPKRRETPVLPIPQRESPPSPPRQESPPGNLMGPIPESPATEPSPRLPLGNSPASPQAGQPQSVEGLDRLLKIPEEKKPSKKGLKPEFSEERGATITTKDGKVAIEHTFSASGSFSVSLLPELKAGSAAAFRSFEFKSTGENTSETLQSIFGTVFSTLETSIKLEILRLEIEKIGFSLKGGLTGQGSVKEHYGPEHGRTGELGAEAKAKLGYTSPSLRLWPLGNLSAGATAEGTAGVTRSLGVPPGTMPPATSGATRISAAFKAELKALLESLGLSIGSVTVRVIGDAHTAFSVEAEPGKTTSKVGVGGMMGLKLQTKEFKATLKLIGDLQRSLGSEPGKKTSVNVVFDFEF